MLSGISSLLELNLQEAHNLQELLKPEVQEMNKDHLIMDDQQLESTYSNIISNLKTINKQQNDRFLVKISELNDRINDLESQLEQKFKDERHLVNLINSTTCIQKVMYKENINDEYFESGVLYIQDNIILIAQHYYADYQIYFKVQDISNIQYFEQNSFEITYKDQTLIIQLDSQEEFNKMDLLLWLHARIRQLDHKLIFQNHLFESPFINETIIDFQRVREDVKLLVKAQEIEKTKAIISSDILHQSLIQLQSPIKDQKIELDMAILLLKQGYEFIKYSQNQRNPNIRIVYLTQDERYLKWKERSQPFDKNVKDRAIALGSIKEIKPIGEGQGFDKFAKKRNQNEDLGITIYGSRNLELDATSMEEKKSFLDCIYIALQNHKMINTY